MSPPSLRVSPRPGQVAVTVRSCDGLVTVRFKPATGGDSGLALSAKGTEGHDRKPKVKAGVRSTVTEAEAGGLSAARRRDSDSDPGRDPACTAARLSTGSSEPNSP